MSERWGFIDIIKLISKNQFLSEKEIFEYTELILNQLNLIDGVNNIVFDDINSFALYNYDKKILILNIKKILKYYQYNLNIQSNVSNLYYFVNLEIIKIIMHEINHVKQHKNPNEVIAFSVLRENKLKFDKKYDELMYRCNPLERQSSIFSICYLISNNVINKNFLKTYYEELLRIIKFGYEKLYPAKIYFDDTMLLNKLNNLPFSFNNKIEYGLDLKI